MHLWNVLDFGMLSIFVASFTARFMAFLKASKAQQYVDMHVPDEDLSNASLPEEVAYFTYGEQECRVSMMSAKNQDIHPSIHSCYFVIALLLFSFCVPARPPVSPLSGLHSLSKSLCSLPICLFFLDFPRLPCGPSWILSFCCLITCGLSSQYAVSLNQLCLLSALENLQPGFRGTCHFYGESSRQRVKVWHKMQIMHYFILPHHTGQ